MSDSLATWMQHARYPAAFRQGSKPDGGNPHSRGSVHESPVRAQGGDGFTNILLRNLYERRTHTLLLYDVIYLVDGRAKYHGQFVARTNLGVRYRS